ncbi:hypothetical protein ROSMUCSMR3_02941 [Roseovarius mucosus]|uniref:Uncharacterized protein n=1 Tax=Roseovarius mucosus TaxID=215743 RepID=A0A1V0RRJ5_9RHOB|nr:hypothetical protein ROSMUCSMR3_02941 [Roseovarius mucosus]
MRGQEFFYCRIARALKPYSKHFWNADVLYFHGGPFKVDCIATLFLRVLNSLHFSIVRNGRYRLCHIGRQIYYVLHFIFVQTYIGPFPLPQKYILKTLWSSRDNKGVLDFF